MNDKEYKIQRKRIVKLANKWTNLVGLRNWRITYEIVREEDNTPPPRTNQPMVADHWQTSMATTADPYYLQARVTVFAPAIQDLNDEDVEEFFLHELAHIIVSPMHSHTTRKEEELVATTIARAIQAVYEQGAKVKPIKSSRRHEKDEKNEKPKKHGRPKTPRGGTSKPSGKDKQGKTSHRLLAR